MRAIIAATALTVALPEMAFADRAVQTPSGTPDAVFEGTAPKEVVSKITNTCMNAGWTVQSQTDTQVVCEIPVSGMKQALQQVLLGNSYSTPPRTFARFTVAQVGASSRAQAMAWTETQMAFGQMRQQQYSDDGTYTNLLSFLIKAGGELPPGTTFVGNYIGFDGDPVSSGKAAAFPVTAVTAGGPGAQAGLLVGDVIHKINGQTFKDQADFTKKINKIGVGLRYPLEIVRDGKPQTLQVIAKARPAVGSPEHEAQKAAALIARGAAPAPAGPSAPSTGANSGTKPQ